LTAGYRREFFAPTRRERRIRRVFVGELSELSEFLDGELSELLYGELGGSGCPTPEKQRQPIKTSAY
jgi:hypothetical protein